MGYKTLIKDYRKTTQYLMPAHPIPQAKGIYHPYPFHPTSNAAIYLGYENIAKILLQANTIILDGFPGVFWENIKHNLQNIFNQQELKVHWVWVEQALKTSADIDRLIQPYLGGDDPLFGYRFQGKLIDFFDKDKLSCLRLDPSSDINIIYGTGAALAGFEGLLVYVDVPKNEIQFRARARSIKNIGAKEPLDPKIAYKRSYFIDWVAANQHKAELLPKMDWYIDEQRPDDPSMISGEALRANLSILSQNYFRVRPWFEPGPWGGQWIKKKIPLLAQDVPNYAWSFELIVPENGLVFEANNVLLEASFDLIMYQNYQNILGFCAENFKYDFPIRYDFLDTVEGGNLSIQCHPQPEYIRKNFGERFTQDECYYILDCVPGATVHLGFQEDIDPSEFREVLINSVKNGQPVDIKKYVIPNPVKKHDFLLIPGGTVHGSGIGNLVLEISATTYIFTFKMYDWLRLDLNGQPRPLNIERAFDNLDFQRKGKRIQEEFISKPSLMAHGNDWAIYHLPTHPNQFYDVHRLEFCGAIQQNTEGSCHVLSLVEGETVLLRTANGKQARFNYAETFVIPAAAESYWLESEDGSQVKVVKTFIKPKDQWMRGSVPDESE